MNQLGLPGKKIKECLDQTSLSEKDKKIIQELIEKNNKEIAYNVTAVVAAKTLKHIKEREFSAK